MSYPSITFGRKIRELFKKYYAIDVRVVFTTLKVRNYFSLKCKTPLALQSNVAYKYNCLCDTSIAYIGKTSRNLVTRVRKHNSSLSAISDNLNVCGTYKHNFSCSNFKILDCGKSKFGGLEINIQIRRKRKREIYIKGEKREREDREREEREYKGLSCMIIEL